MKEKPDLFLLHGALGTSDQFNSLIPHLENLMNVHVFDFYGHGANASIEDYSMHSFSIEVEKRMYALGLASAHFFGYSMGGYVALTLAGRKPALIQSITTLGTKFNWNAETAAAETKLLVPEKMLEKVPAFTSRLALAHSENDWKSVVVRTAKMMNELGREAESNLHSFNAISSRVLLAVGAKDNMVSEEETRFVAESLANGRFECIDGFYHPLEKNDPKSLSKLIIKQVLPSMRA